MLSPLHSARVLNHCDDALKPIRHVWIGSAGADNFEQRGFGDYLGRKYGRVRCIRVTKHCTLVSFHTADEALAAVRGLDGGIVTSMHGRPVRVDADFNWRERDREEERQRRDERGGEWRRREEERRRPDERGEGWRREEERRRPDKIGEEWRREEERRWREERREGGERRRQEERREEGEERREREKWRETEEQRRREIEERRREARGLRKGEAVMREYEPGECDDELDRRSRFRNERQDVSCFL